MMKKMLVLAAFTAMAVTGASAQILINEVYPGGGASSGTPAFTRDFVEIYNTSAIPFSLAGFSLQYSAAGATSDFTNALVNFGTGSIIAGNDYITIETGSAGTAGATLAVGNGAGNATYLNASGPGLSASSGSVRLINLSTNVVLDLVGYGTITASTLTPAPTRVEGTAAATPTSTAVSIGRTGFIDTNNNSADFTSMTPSPNAGTVASIVVPAPEPSTWVCMLGGLGGLAWFIRRRRVA